MSLLVAKPGDRNSISQPSQSRPTLGASLQSDIKMKQTILILTFLTFFILSSCNSFSGRKKLNLTTIENEEILIEKYRISEISTIHQFIDITNKRWNKKERILEANDGSIDSIFIRQDTLYLQKTSKQPVIYDLASIKFGYKIILLEPNKD